MSDLAERVAELDRQWLVRPCPTCAEATPRAEPACVACGVEHADFDDQVALIEGVEAAAELLGWTGAPETEAELAHHPQRVAQHQPEFQARCDELGVDLATAALHWAENQVDSDWIERARRGAAPDTPAARTLGKGASELSERAIRDAEAMEARVRRVRAGVWIVSIAAALGAGYGLLRLVTG